MLTFLVFNKTKAENYELNVPHVNISISTPVTPKARLSPLTTRKDALFVSFHDCDKLELKGVYAGCFIGKEVSYIKESQAKEIVDFYLKWKNLVNIFIINCEAGISRSSATAAALSVISGQGDDFIFKSPKYHPNMLVYRTILNHYFKS